MAHLLNATRFKSPNPSQASFTVTIPATTAGSTLVCIAGGGATIAAHLGSTTGTLFTARVNSLATRQVIAQDIVDASGGTTAIGFVLNGAENIDGMIYEFAAGSLGAYINGTTNGSTGGNANVNSEGQGIVGTLTTTGASVLFMMFTAGDGTSTSTRQWWGMEPLGKQSANEYIQTDPAKSKYWSMIGMSAQSAAGTFNGKSDRNTLSGEHQSIMAAYTDNQPGTATYTAWPNGVAAENSLPGVDRQVFNGVNTNPHISGYTDQTSYLPGSTVNFKIFSENTQFRVDIYRFGFYGYPTFSGRRVASVTGTPAIQPAPTVNSYGGTVCAWSTTASWAVPASATPGVYLFQMVRTDNTAYQAQGIFVVRSVKPGSKNAAKTAIVLSDTSWQAYNLWGGTADTGTGIAGYSGRDLYNAAPASPGMSGRSFAVSFDRPMATGAQNNVTYFWDSESSLINFLEGNGYDLDYYSSIDLEQDPTILSQYGVAVCSGHAEYWTDNMRNAYENARDAGTNLAFFSSNTALWRVRFAASDTNKRNLICYKDSADTTGFDNTTKYDPVSYTGTYRDIRTTVGGVNNTARRPESGMTGLWFIGNGPFNDTIAVPNSYRTLPIWRNTTFAAGVSITAGTTNSGALTTAGTSIIVNQPTSTALGDLVIVALTFNGNPGSYANNGARLVRQIIGTNQSTVVFAYYATTAGAAAITWSWGTSLMASVVTMNYQNAVWNDSGFSIASDTGGTAAHTTDSITAASNDRWAVCLFTDADTTGTKKTTSWTAGTGLTSRVQTNNSAAVGGPWNSIALMDSGAAVTQAAHSYSATAQFANPVATTCIMYITPGTTLYANTIGYEWDYLKPEEPTSPTNVVRLSDQIIPLTNAAADYNGATYANSGLYRYGMVLSRASSGALVFNAGTWRFQWGISLWRGATFDTSAVINTTMQQALLNLFRDLGVAPTTLLSVAANVLNTPALVDPGAAQPSTAYGLTLTDPGYQTIFGTTVPANRDNGLASDVTLGTLFTAAVDGKVYGIRWHFPETKPNREVVGLLYGWTNDTSGTEIARVTAVNTQTGWNNLMFNSPVDITRGTRYVAAVWTYDRDVLSSGMLASAVTNGQLTAPADTTGAHNGKYVLGSGAPSFPATSGAGNSYMVDILYIGKVFEGWGMPM